ncbi:MAG: HAD family hydrolase [Succinivibrionaceae bacterium]
MFRIKAIIFDIDGTLMDSIGRITKCIELACERCGLSIPQDSSTRNIIGLSLPLAIKTLFPHEDINRLQEVAEAYKNIYIELETKFPVKLFDDAIPVLKSLRSKGYKIGIATGKSRHGYNRVAEYSNLKSFVEVSVTGDEYKSKPDPEMLISCAKKLNLECDECLMIGDSILDIMIGNNANMKTVGVLTGVHTKEQLSRVKPTMIVHNLTELLKIL